MRHLADSRLPHRAGPMSWKALYRRYLVQVLLGAAALALHRQGQRLLLLPACEFSGIWTNPAIAAAALIDEHGQLLRISRNVHRNYNPRETKWKRTTLPF